LARDVARTQEVARQVSSGENPLELVDADV
jgi:hypothetical protein